MHSPQFLTDPWESSMTVTLGLPKVDEYGCRLPYVCPSHDRIAEPRASIRATRSPAGYALGGSRNGRSDEDRR